MLHCIVQNICYNVWYRMYRCYIVWYRMWVTLRHSFVIFYDTEYMLYCMIQNMCNIISYEINVILYDSHRCYIVWCRIDDVKWSGKTIVVLNDVNIVEPYTENDLQVISGRNPSSFDHISKIVSNWYISLHFSSMIISSRW